jgi:hypothetical protein
MVGVDMGVIRVTRLVEFSPIVRIFYFGHFLQSTQNLLGFFFQRQNLCITSDKNVLGYNILGDFFTNQSGRPVLKEQPAEKIMSVIFNCPPAYVHMYSDCGILGPIRKPVVTYDIKAVCPNVFTVSFLQFVYTELST